MSSHVEGQRPAPRGGAVRSRVSLTSHWTWLTFGLTLAFLIPFVLTDAVGLNRDVFYGLYALSVVGLLAGWSRATGHDLNAALHRHLSLAIGLGLGAAAILTAMVLGTETATTRPDGVDLAAALLWRGVVYGAADGLLLSVFPILLVFAALSDSKLNEHLRGKIAIGVVALLASVVMTAVYHLGYIDFRSEKLRKPVLGDTIWSVPTLVTLNPVGAPIAHIGLHVSAVLHSYETQVFLPPH